MTRIASDVLAQVDELQSRYIRALDTKNVLGWTNTFTREENASYICIAAENENNHLPIALMHDDSRERIEDRVVFIEKIWVNTFQDYDTRHFIQRMYTEPIDENLYLVESNFSIIYTLETGRSTVQVAGMYKDKIKITECGACFMSKRAVYDTNVLPRYVVYPF